MEIRRSNIRLTVYVVFVLGYVLLGALVFCLIEGPREQAWRDELRQVKSSFLHTQHCVTDDELEALIVEIVMANNRGVSAVGNVSGESNWSFGQSIFFAGTVLTTIGYGHVTPLSQGGKVFCIVYALMGIPLILIMFTALVERLMLITSKLLQWLTVKLGHLYKTFHIRLLHLGIVFSFLVIFIFIIPATLFTVFEDGWNFLDAIYYCFISMTTIGLGDYIPGDQPHQQFRPLYKIMTTIYLFLGLVMMMLMLANIYEVPELNIGLHFYMRSDEEKDERQLLRSAGDQGPRYTEQVDDKSGSRILDDSSAVPTPDEP